MNKITNGLQRLGWATLRWTTLCGACAIWATASLPAQAGPPRGGNHAPHGESHRGSNGINRSNGPYGGYGYSGFGGWGIGAGGLFGFDLTGNENQIPYFAAHPPVYYSYPIARPYGDSPFPYPPGMFVPTATDGGPQMIINPYAQPGSEAPSSAAPSTAAPANPSPSSALPAPPAPSHVKPTSSRTASLIQSASPSVESLPSPNPIAFPAAASPAISNVRVVMNPFVK